MPITSRKTRSLFSSETLSFAAQHRAKSDRSGAGRSFSSPQPAADRHQRAADWQANPATDNRRVKLPCPPVEGDPAAVTWVTFRETYANLAQQALSKYTVIDWRRAESILDEEFTPKLARDLTAEMFEDFELFVCKVGYSKPRVDNMVSRLRQMILWGCEAGYLEREAFGLGPELKWPLRLVARDDDRGWRDARRQYEVTILNSMASRTTAIALDDFERLCGPPSLANAIASLPAFVEALRREAVDRTSIEIYREAVVAFVSWTSNQWRVAA